MPIYWKPWHSLEDRKSFLQKIIQLTITVLVWLMLFDIFLIYYFWTQPIGIIIWSAFVLLIMRKDIIGIAIWLSEIRKMGNNIDKGLFWEIQVAETLNKLASQNGKFYVFHDVFIWHENIDHIIVYDNRIVIAIETKSYARFPYGLYLKRVNYQIRRQRNFLHEKTWLYIHSLWVFTEAFVEPFKYEKEIAYINIEYLEKKIEKIVQSDVCKNIDATQKIISIQEKYHSKKLGYRELLLTW